MTLICLALGLVNSSPVNAVQPATPSDCVVDKAFGPVFYSGNNLPSPEIAGLDDCVGREEKYEEETAPPAPDNSGAGIIQPILILLFAILFIMNVPCIDFYE